MLAKIDLDLGSTPRAFHVGCSADAQGASSCAGVSGSPGNDGADLDDIVGFEHLVLGNELVAADDHCRARQDAELAQDFAGTMPATDFHFTVLWQ